MFLFFIKKNIDKTKNNEYYTCMLKHKLKKGSIYKII